MAIAKVAVKTGVIDGILGAGLAVQGLLFLMLGLSVVSWAIIIIKRRQLRAMTSANELFVESF